jgi:hypothetical protein
MGTFIMLHSNPNSCKASGLLPSPAAATATTKGPPLTHVALLLSLGLSNLILNKRLLQDDSTPTSCW